MRIQIPAGNILKGVNSLKIWGVNSEVGSVAKILIVASEEAKLLKEAFTIDGSLTGLARKGTAIDAAVSADQAAQIIIGDMEADSRLSPSEKATWRNSWVAITTDYTELVLYAATVVQDSTNLTTTFTALQTTLAGTGVWTNPDVTFILSGSEISDAFTAYNTEYNALGSLCTTAVAVSSGSVALAAAQTYAIAQAQLAETQAKAHADGIVTAEEERAIADAIAKADAARDEAITAARAQSVILANSAEETAKDYALIKAQLAEATSKAWADGKITEEENRAIADATLKATNAKNEAISAAGSASVSRIAAAKLVSDKYSDDIKDAIDSQLIDIQNQVDGAQVSWFLEGVPTLLNAPADAWTTDLLKDAHLSDLYYDTDPLTAQAHKFDFVGGVYQWVPIQDAALTKALTDASRAQSTADGKIKTFLVQPTPPYALGDMWLQGVAGDIVHCTTARTSGGYQQGDWALSTSYTNDSGIYYPGEPGAIDGSVISIDSDITVLDRSTQNYCSLTSGDLEFFLYTGTKHVRSKSLRNIVTGTAASGKSQEIIGGYFSAPPQVLVSPRIMPVYNAAYPKQDQSVSTYISSDVEETAEGSFQYKFTAICKLNLSSYSYSVLNTDTDFQRFGDGSVYTRDYYTPEVALRANMSQVTVNMFAIPYINAATPTAVRILVEVWNGSEWVGDAWQDYPGGMPPYLIGNANRNVSSPLVVSASKFRVHIIAAEPTAYMFYRINSYSATVGPTSEDVEGTLNYIAIGE